jgi:phenylacetate-CoA ligase
VLNTFGYHLTPAGLLMDDGARSIGCAVIPAGGGNTEQIVQAMRAYAPSAYIGTADYLNILLEAADRTNTPVALRRALMSGAAVPRSLREAFSARGIEAFELYGTAELGIVAYETEAHEGFVVNEDILVEIVEPGGGKPMPEGEIGEVVVTRLDPDYPLIRFATGDLSATLPGRSPCGRTNMRLRGWLGRADDAVKVKGMFLRPDQLRDLIARSKGLVGRARFVVDRENERDRLTLEVEGTGDEAATARIETLIRETTRLGGRVRWVDALPAEVKPIVDERPIG